MSQEMASPTKGARRQCSRAPWQFRMTAASERAAHLFGIRGVDRATMPSIQEALEQRNVYVSLRGDAVRVSPHLYNDASDIAALAEAIMAA